MVNQQLVNYISTQLKSAYSINQIKDFLLKKGYSQEAIFEASKEAYKKRVTFLSLLRIPLPIIAIISVVFLDLALGTRINKWIYLVFLALLGLGGIVYVVYSISKNNGTVKDAFYIGGIIGVVISGAFVIFKTTRLYSREGLWIFLLFTFLVIILSYFASGIIAAIVRKLFVVKYPIKQHIAEYFKGQAPVFRLDMFITLVGRSYIGLFLLSAIFLGYVTGNIINVLLFLISLVVLVFVADLAHKHKIEYVSYLTLFLFLIAYITSIYLFIIAIIAFVIAVLHYYESGKKHNIITTSLAVFMAITIATAIASIILFFTIFVILPQLGYLNYLAISLLLSPTIITLAVLGIFLGFRFVHEEEYTPTKHDLVKGLKYGVVLALILLILLFNGIITAGVRLTGDMSSKNHDIIYNLERDIIAESQISMHEISEFTIIKELNNELNLLRNNTGRNEFYLLESGSSLSGVLKGRHYERVFNQFLILKEKQETLDYINFARRIADKEWEMIKLNQKNGALLPDNSSNLKEHIARLQDEVEQFEIKVRSTEDIKGNLEDLKGRVEFKTTKTGKIVSKKDLYSSAMYKIISHDLYWEALLDHLIKISQESAQRKSTWVANLKKDIEESDESKAIRLQILNMYFVKRPHTVHYNEFMRL